MLRQVAEALLWPFDILPRRLGLLVFSVVSGLLMLLVVGKATPQAPPQARPRADDLRHLRAAAVPRQPPPHLPGPGAPGAVEPELPGLPAARLRPAAARCWPCCTPRWRSATGSPRSTATATPSCGVDLRRPAAASRSRPPSTAGARVRLAAPPVLVPDERVLYLRLGDRRARPAPGAHRGPGLAGGEEDLRRGPARPAGQRRAPGRPGPPVRAGQRAAAALGRPGLGASW